MDAIIGLWMLGMLAALYFVPAIVAFMGQHPQRWAS